ncbi:unnamed protein product [Polarella glacialis]|uniref:J domain-containing protein n=1 Tax=Polarella glacialis TaxID=89957 RepID=A0A813FA78_POLGL|nr:unnamed protein product [Polarella glacialis]
MAGAIQNWNNQNPDRAVEAGDSVIAVNGQAGDAQAMVKQIKETSILEMLIRKPEPAAPEPPVDFGVQRAGVFIPGLTPARVVDVLLDIRARAAEKKSSNEVPGGTAASKGGASAGGIGSEPPNHYQVLVLPMKVDDTEIKKSYRKLVLQWHPDKQPGNREEADVKIRLINSAYECLSNPLKRQSYDQMLAALERKRLGVRLETQFIKPRMSIPKEFMLCPLGSTDRFVRVVKDKLVVQSREEAAGVSFQDFFQGAKFSLWWLPEVNNMCRLRARETAGSGVDGGMNVSFAFDGGKEDDHDAEADTALTPSQDMRKCNLMVIPSPFSAGAFRFEGAFFPGRMLSFRSPNKLLMAGKADEGSDIADFVLVDYSAAYKFMTTSEVLKGACESQGGKNGEYVKLSDLRADLSVRLYFQQMLGCAVWNNKDFETFFEGHYEEWDFILSKAKVRIRPGGPLDRKVEEPESSAADEPMPEAPAKETEEPSRGADAGSLGEKLRTAGSQMGIVKVLMAAAGDDLAKLPVSTVGPTLQRLGEKAGSGKASDKEDLTAARRRFLLALPLVLGEAANSGSSRARGRGSSTLETGVSISHLLGMKKAVANIAANDQAPDLAKVCQSATESIADVVGSRVRQAPEEVGLDILSDIFALPMNWRSVASSLADAISPLLKKQGPGALLPALRAGSKLPKDARPVLEALARAELKNVGFADAAVAANVLLTIAEAGVEGEGVASRLRPPLLQRVALPDLVSIVAALGEKRLEADLLRPALQARVAVAGPALAAVPPANLLRLAKASTRSPVVAECALGPVAGAAATTSTGEGQMAFAAIKADGSVVTWGDARGGDSSAIAPLLTEGVVQVCLNIRAFAAVKADGSVVTWGDAVCGGDSSSVAPLLMEGVVQVFSNNQAFAAIKVDGSLVTWGVATCGGDSSALAPLLTEGIVQVCGNMRAFVAIKADGSAVTWGGSGSGGDSSAVAPLLTEGIVQVCGSSTAFAAIKADGSVVTWGDAGCGGNSSAVATLLTDGVVQVCGNAMAFAAIKADGSVVTWGHAGCGGDSSVAPRLMESVVQVCGSRMAFAALKADGSVVTWGQAGCGGDSSAVASLLTQGVVQICGNAMSFAAIKSDGSVVTWGDAGFGGNSSAVTPLLTQGVIQVYSNIQAFAAIKADGSVVTWGSASCGGDSSAVAQFLTEGIVQVF